MMYRVNNPGCLFIIAVYTYLTTDGHYALKVDALEAGKSQGQGLSRCLYGPV